MPCQDCGRATDAEYCSFACMERANDYEADMREKYE